MKEPYFFISQPAGKGDENHRTATMTRRKPKKVMKADQDAPNDQPELGLLLDSTSLTTTDEISRRFDEIAEALFLRYRLCLGCGDGVSPTEFALLQFEFYLKKPGCHEGPFTHGSEEPKQSGRWFV
jgi:hypothetical protein